MRWVEAERAALPQLGDDRGAVSLQRHRDGGVGNPAGDEAGAADVGRAPIDVDRSQVDPLDDRVPEVAADPQLSGQLRGALDLDHEDGHASSCSTAKLTVRFAASAARSRARTRVPGSGQPPSTRARTAGSTS